MYVLWISLFQTPPWLTLLVTPPGLLMLRERAAEMMLSCSLASSVTSSLHSQTPSLPSYGSILAHHNYPPHTQNQGSGSLLHPPQPHHHPAPPYICPKTTSMG